MRRIHNCSQDEIDAQLPFAEVIRANADLWNEVAALNAEYRRFPLAEGADMVKLYPEYEDVRVRAERTIERIRAELAKEGIAFDNSDLTKLWAFLHAYYFQPLGDH